MNGFSLGRYVPLDTPLHRLDPRAKIFALVALMVACFLPFERFLTIEGKTVAVTFYCMSALMFGFMFLLSLILFFVGRIGFLKLFSSMKALWFTVVLLLIIYVLVPNYATPTLGVAWTVPAMNWTVYWDSFAGALRIVLRLVLVLMLTFVLTATTKPLDLTYAFEWYLTPFKVFHLPTAEIAMTISIALRFIPTLLDDVSRISKAQASRGAAFQKGGIGKKLVGITSLIVPIFVSAFLRSEDLANAMICRGYDPKAKRTRYRQFRFHFSDILVFLVCAGILAGYITLSVMHFDPFMAIWGVNLP